MTHSDTLANSMLGCLFLCRRQLGLFFLLDFCEIDKLLPGLLLADEDEALSELELTWRWDLTKPNGKLRFLSVQEVDVGVVEVQSAALLVVVEVWLSNMPAGKDMLVVSAAVG